MIAWLLFAVVIALQVLDLLTTLKAIQSGKGHEANPLMVKLMHRIGLLPTLLLTKGSVIAFVIAGIRFHWWAGNMVYLLAALALFYAVIIVNNFRVLRP